MNTFINENFILESAASRELYHTYAAQMPIIDYHCHLNPEMIASDHRFSSLTEIWLGGDHYKWRALRTNGINENTSQAPPPIGKNSRNGPEQSLTPCAIRYITGHTSN